MGYFGDQILALTKQLYPTGRAFKIKAGGYFDKLHQALALSEERAYQDAISIRDSMFPDNTNFTTSDAADWERRLGLITNPYVSLSDRMLAIKRKMAHPGTIIARQNYRYVQEQLQAAGFNVYVYENRYFGGNPIDYYGYYTKSFVTWASASYMGHGDFEHGVILSGGSYQVSQHGVDLQSLVANFINEADDLTFDVGSNLRSTFFIAGTPEGIPATVPYARKDEFRQLVLRLKPVQTVAYLLINFN